MGWAWCRWCCRQAPIRRPSRSATRPMSGRAAIFNSGFLDGLDVDGGEARGDRRAGAARRRPWRGELAAARLGREPAALLGLPDPGDPLRRLRRGAGAGRSVAGETARRRDVRPAGQSARSSSDLEARRLPALRRRGTAGDRHVRHLRRQLLVFRALLQPAGRRAGGARRRSITGCRSISISAASSTRSCICCIRASSPAR